MSLGQSVRLGCDNRVESQSDLSCPAICRTPCEKGDSRRERRVPSDTGPDELQHKFRSSLVLRVLNQLGRFESVDSGVTKALLRCRGDTFSDVFDSGGIESVLADRFKGTLGPVAAGGVKADPEGGPVYKVKAGGIAVQNVRVDRDVPCLLYTSRCV